jgi:ATP-dependent DNA helicase RecG
MEIRVLRQLVLNPKSKAQLSEAMGQKAISDQLNKVIRVLVADQTIEPTIPDKPTSRLQTYRLTEKGSRLLELLDKDGDRS